MSSEIEAKHVKLAELRKARADRQQAETERRQRLPGPSSGARRDVDDLVNQLVGGHSGLNTGGDVTPSSSLPNTPPRPTANLLYGSALSPSGTVSSQSDVGSDKVSTGTTMVGMMEHVDRDVSVLTLRFILDLINVEREWQDYQRQVTEEQDADVVHNWECWPPRLTLAQICKPSTQKSIFQGPWPSDIIGEPADHPVINMGGRKRNSSADERPTVKEVRAKIDKRPVEANTPANDPAQATQKMDMQLAKCRLGVAYIDIVKIQNPLLFGKYNNRPQKESLRCEEDTAIPIMLSSTRLKSGLRLALNFNEEEVPQLQLKDAHDIVVASGQHRVTALKKYSKNLMDEVASTKKRRHKIGEMKNPTEEHVAEYNCLRNELGELKGALILMGKWGVIVYDEDAVLAHGNPLANHLCRNKILHEYKETTEEVLSSILLSVKAAYNNAPKEERVAAALGELRLQRDNTERQKNTQLTKVLSYEKLVLTLALDLLPLGSHFRRRKEFCITWLAQSIDVVMGMFIQFIQIHSHILQLLASNDAFPDYATVRNTIAAAYDEGSDRDMAVTQLKEWRQMIYDSTVDPDVAVFNDVFDDISIYIEDLENYSNYLVSKLRSKWHLSRDASFQLAKRRTEENARLAEEAALKAASAVPPPPDSEADKMTFTETPEFETTYTTNVTTRNASTSIAKTASTGISKKKVKPKLTAKEKKERSLSLEKIVTSLPLEFQGSDPGLRRNMESVIEFMMDSDGRGIKLIELIKPPDLNQAPVNK
ncbi:hypothetical protein EDB19DRAFT_1917761 [Suillus lakei]|nr:hypothetical protein EDB19DRAFT_1917761 [Suillus lakei]